ncbi:MAG: hypothetical protein ACXWKR_05105 [Phenylobacterium sp.]
MVMITRPWPGGIEIRDLADAGLPAASVIRPCKIATIEARHAEVLGQIRPALMAEAQTNVRSNRGTWLMGWMSTRVWVDAVRDALVVQVEDDRAVFAGVD